ncbi:polycystin-1-like protein 2 [Ptychodera flava]|uniref:polycystin-1-like protein 2 n=1 Tax=Ptychodera flava TaxID=63121 RepID=UPI00396A525F
MTTKAPAISNTTEYLKILKRFEDIDAHISQLWKGNLTQNMSIVSAQEILDEVQAVYFDVMVHVDGNVNRERQRTFTKSVLTVADNIANFILSKMTSGSTVVVLKTHSLVLNLEKNTVQNLSHGTLMVGPHSGFEIPSAEHIFPHLSSNVTLNRVVYRFGPELHHISNVRDQFATDILTLSFKNESGQENMVQNAAQDIGIWLGNSQTPLNGTYVKGQYVGNDATTHYLLEVTAFKPLHAIQIVLATSSPVFENTTAYISTKSPGNFSGHSGFQFSSEVSFNGSVASILLPEGEITKAGIYYVTFDLVYSHGVEFRVSTTQHRCRYSIDNANSWQDGGCRVSPKSNVNSTLCLCNHLTTFTST